MLSSVLNSPRAIQVNVHVMRAFVQLRKVIASSPDLWKKIVEMEEKYDQKFKVVFDAIRLMMKQKSNKQRIGFDPLDNGKE